MVFKTNIKFLIVSFLTLFLLLAALLFFFIFRSSEIVYVDNAKLFEGFNMTKEMKREGEIHFAKRKNKLDSLYNVINNMSGSNQGILSKQFVLERNAYEEESQAYAMQESEKIWKRLNDYVKEYSTNKGFKIVLGQTNPQQVLYVDSKVDITQDMITFINSKYEGEN